MSFEEPKAPIVRIRKKRTKRKSKDNDIVHLPMRASRQARYASLTTPTNPQSKGRECCRTIFASCFKIPVCKTLCFRCILPQCYNGEGSDEDEGEARDEGYHSQNRRSSEIAPTPGGGTSGATGGATDIEMTELKSETAAFIPPPRTTTNDYRKDPFHTSSSSNTNSKQSITDGDDAGDEVTYIEVESVSLPGDRIYIPESNLLSEISELVNLSKSETEIKTEICVSEKVSIPESCYEDPLKTESAHEIPAANSTKVKIVEVSSTRVEDISEYVGCDSDDSESHHYVNEDILHKPSENPTEKVKEPAIVKREPTKVYANSDAVNVSTDKVTLHSKNEKDTVKGPLKVETKKAHNYVNLNHSVSDTDKKDVSFEGMVKTSSAEFKQLLEKSVLKSSDGRSRSSGNTVDVNGQNSDAEEHTAHKGDHEKLIKNEPKDKVDKTEAVIDSESEQTNTEQDERTVSDQTKLI